MSYSNKDSGFGGCILTITFFFSTLFVMFLLGRSTVAKKEIIIENSRLPSYIEAAKRLELEYKIENSGEKRKKIIISFSE
ncbi:MAG: hypothetical protein Q4A23_00560 [bacterium]|nr:hypothetical protein [bacterium]